MWTLPTLKINQIPISHLVPETPNSWIPIQPIQTPTPSSSPNVKELGARSEIYNRPTPMPWWPSLAPSESRGSIYQPEPPFPLPMPSPSFPSPSFHKIGLIQVPVTLYPPSSAPLNSLQPTRQPALENPYEPSGVASSAVEMPPASFAGRTGEKQTSVVEMGESLTLRQLYERALRALCRWLPRIFKHITYQGCSFFLLVKGIKLIQSLGCMTGGQRAIRCFCWLINTNVRVFLQLTQMDGPTNSAHNFISIRWWRSIGKWSSRSRWATPACSSSVGSTFKSLVQLSNYGFFIWQEKTLTVDIARSTTPRSNK